MKPEELAKQNFATLLDYLQSENWNFQEHVDDDEYSVIITFKTEDFPLINMMTINTKDKTFIIESLLDFKVGPDERGDIPVALMLINATIKFGRFDMLMARERIIYSYAHYYGDNNISYEQYAQIISISNLTVDHYNEKFFYLTKKKMTLRDLVASIQNRK